MRIIKPDTLLRWHRAGLRLFWKFRWRVQTQPLLLNPLSVRSKRLTMGGAAKAISFGAFQPASGEALTLPYARRITANWIDLLERVEHWIPARCERIDVIVDNLSMHRATYVLLLSLAHPRWEFVFQPKYAAYLNLIKPWWKILRPLALKGRRFETWQAIEQAISEATAYWNQHRHPFIWGRRRRHPARRTPGIALVAAVS